MYWPWVRRAGQIVEAGGDVGMDRTQRLFPDGQGPLVEGHGLGVLALGPIEVSQIVEAGGDSGMDGAQGLFPDGQSPLVSGTASRILALGPIEFS